MSQSSDYEEFQRIYQNTWDEYFRHDSRDTEQTLEYLKQMTKKNGKKRRVPPVECKAVNRDDYKLPNCVPTRIEECMPILSNDTEAETNPDDGVECYTIETSVFEAPKFEPFPPYESATPAMSSTMSYEYRVYEDSELPFFPISGDLDEDSWMEAANELTASGLYEHLAWQWRAERRIPGCSFLLLLLVSTSTYNL